MLQFRILEYEGNFWAWSTFTSSFADKKTEAQRTYLPKTQFSLVFTIEWYQFLISILTSVAIYVTVENKILKNMEKLEII